jgi:outer membrane protein assembly factor BamB
LFYKLYKFNYNNIYSNNKKILGENKMNKKQACILVTTLLFATSFSVAAPLNLTSDKNSIASPITANWWPQIGHDAANTGFTTETAPNTNFLLWQFTDLNAGWMFNPVVVNGKVYAGSRNGTMYCLNAGNGAVIWQQKFGVALNQSSSPVVADGKVFIGQRKTLYSFDAETGTPGWNRTFTTSEVFYNLANGLKTDNGRIYLRFLPKTYCLYASNGTSAWEYDGGPNWWSIYSTLAIADGKVYSHFMDTTSYKLLCLYASNGTAKWTASFPLGGYYEYTPTVTNGKVFVDGGGSNKLRCLDANTGVSLWNFTASTSAERFGNIAVSSDKVFSGTGPSGALYCIWMSNGTQKWKTGSGNFKQYYALADNKIFMTSTGSISINCYNMENGSLKWTSTGHLGAGSTSIAEGKIYYGMTKNGVYCFRDDSPPVVPSAPSGPIAGAVGANVTFTVQGVSDPNNDDVAYEFNWGDGTTTTTGFVPSGEGSSASHSWTDEGIFHVKVRARDHWLSSNYSDNATIQIGHPPETPTVQVPTYGPLNGSTIITVQAHDSDSGDQVRFGIIWGDGSSEQLTTYYASDVVAQIAHKYTKLGVFNISVVAEDTYGERSTYSNAKTVTIVVPTLSIGNFTSNTFLNSLLHGGTVSAELTNTGLMPIQNITYTITLGGGAIIWKGEKQKNGTIASLNPGESQVLQTTGIRGFGLMPVTITVTANDIADNETTVQAFQLFFYTKLP